MPPKNTDTQAPHTHLDDQFRDAAQHQLNDVPLNAPLPSTSSLNKCLRQAMGRFLILLPIVHVPSFVPDRSNAWLLVAMCSLGSQLIQCRDALSHGHRMFESLHRAILSSWSTFSTPRPDWLCILQATVFGQTHAMLSSHGKYLHTAQAFHGTLIHGYRVAL